MRDDSQVQSLQAWPENSGLDLAEEQCHAAPVGREGVAELAGHGLDESLALETTQVVAHLSRGVLLISDSEKLSDQRTEAAIGDPLPG